MAERGLTYANLVAMPDDGTRRELVGGELIVSPSPKTRHQRLLKRFAVAFEAHLAAQGGGEMLFAPIDVLLSDADVVQPDLLVVCDADRHIVTDDNIKGVPSLLVEIVSESRYDRVRKRDLYASFGVPEYWIVDPEADRVEVLRLQGHGYARPEVFEPGDTLGYANLPGFTLDLTALFER